MPVIVPSPEKKAVDEALHRFSQGIEQQDDHDRQDQGEDQGISPGRQKEGMEEKDDQDVQGGQDAGQEDIDRPAADEGADIQQVVLEDAEGQERRRG